MAGKVRALNHREAFFRHGTRRGALAAFPRSEGPQDAGRYRTRLLTLCPLGTRGAGSAPGVTAGVSANHLLAVGVTDSTSDGRRANR